MKQTQIGNKIIDDIGDNKLLIMSMICIKMTIKMILLLMLILLVLLLLPVVLLVAIVAAYTNGLTVILTPR
jgi:hypothetical protein